MQPASYCIDQRRFSDIGATCEGDFRQVSRRQSSDRHGAHHEFDLTGEENARRLEILGAEDLAHPEGALPVRRASARSIGLSTLKRRIITYCCSVVSTFDQVQ